MPSFASRLLLPCLLPLLLGGHLAAMPSADAIMLRQIYDEALKASPAFDQLRELTTEYPGRLAGTRALDGALVWAEQQLHAVGVDHVWSLHFTVPVWERGPRETARLLPPEGAEGEAWALSALALGGSPATPAHGLVAEVVEVRSLAQLSQLAPEQVLGRLLFFNRGLDPRHLDPAEAYAEAAAEWQLVPQLAAARGAAGTLLRSLTLARNDQPRAGTSAPPPTLPAASLGIQSADTLSATLATTPGARVELRLHAQWLPDAPTRTVIAELRGREHADRVITLLAHLDCWDITPGAHDNGAGVIQALEVLRIFRALGFTPRHTVRIVLLTDHETGRRGTDALIEYLVGSGESQVVMLECDTGAFTPRGYALVPPLLSSPDRAGHWRELLAPYGLPPGRATLAGSSAIALAEHGFTVGTLLVDPQRYFDTYHARTDTIDAVSPRELDLTVAALTALVYLVDLQGL